MDDDIGAHSCDRDAGQGERSGPASKVVHERTVRPGGWNLPRDRCELREHVDREASPDRVEHLGGVTARVHRDFSQAGPVLQLGDQVVG